MWAFAAGGSFKPLGDILQLDQAFWRCEQSYRSASSLLHLRMFGCGLRHKPPSLCQQGRTEKLKVKPL